MKKWMVLLLAVISVSCSQNRNLLTLFIGTYTDGFYAYSFDEEDGAVVSEGSFPEAPGAFAKACMPNPSYLTRRGEMVYAVSEMSDSTASVWSWKFWGDSLQCVASAPTGGEAGTAPCYVSTDGRYVAVANYSGGSMALYRVQPGGAVVRPDSLILSGAGGPDLRRQGTPHVHCAVFAPDGKYLFFSEFSADAIGSLDIAGHGVSNYRIAARLPADFGPRHLLFDASGEHFYVIGELSGDVAVFDYKAGNLTLRQVVKADRFYARGAADIHLSPDGKFLYASLRLQNDGIAVFSVGADGTRAEVGYQHTGPHPRNFVITKDLAIVACRDSDEIEIYSRDPDSGLLTDTGRRISLPKPVFVSLQE